MHIKTTFIYNKVVSIPPSLFIILLKVNSRLRWHFRTNYYNKMKLSHWMYSYSMKNGVFLRNKCFTFHNWSKFTVMKNSPSFNCGIVRLLRSYEISENISTFSKWEVFDVRQVSTFESRIEVFETYCFKSLFLYMFKKLKLFKIVINSMIRWIQRHIFHIRILIEIVFLF